MYQEEQNAKVKERMLLVLNVVYHHRVAAHVSRDLHRHRSWACQWLKRYDKEGIEGSKDRTKTTGRPPKLSEKIIYRMKTILKENSKQGWWTTKQVEELMVENSGIRYIIILTYTVYFASGVLDRRFYQEKYMLIQHLQKRKRISKKGQQDTCGYEIPQGRVYRSTKR